MNTAEIRQTCLSLPAVTEGVNWEHDLVLSVGGKIFCVVSLQLPRRYSFNVKDEQLEELSRQPGCIPAPYLARVKWVSMTQPELLNDAQAKDYIMQSYQMVKAKLTKKQRTQLGM